MKSKVYSNLLIIAATAVPPCVLITISESIASSEELPLFLLLYLVAHAAIWLGLIPAFRKFPRSSWALCTLLYPVIALAGMLLLISFVNPYAFLYGLLWFGPWIYLELGWVVVPVSGITATIAYCLTRILPAINHTNRGIAAPAS